MEQDCFLLRPIFLRRWLPWTCPRSLSESSTQWGSHLRSAFVRARRSTQNAVVAVCVCVLWPLHICNQPIPQSVSSRQHKLIHRECTVCRVWVHHIIIYLYNYWNLAKSTYSYLLLLSARMTVTNSRPALWSANSMTEATDWMPVATTWPVAGWLVNLPIFLAARMKSVRSFPLEYSLHSLWLIDILLAGRRLGRQAAFEEIDDEN